MKILLKDFQKEAVEIFLDELQSAAIEVRRNPRKLQAVSLASPTGSGKTVIATAAIERILEGYDDQPARPDATFLWITDNPQLNEQTRRKMLGTSSYLGTDRLITVENDWDQETLSPGRVYFLNTQKLGTGNLLVTRGTDKREFSFWDTLTNTAKAHPGDLYVLIDEAHRGMGESPQQQNQARTIIQKFIKGSDEIPPMPLIVGISATITRFDALIGTAGRIKRPCEIKPADVRESGLIKETVLFTHPDEAQASDMTLLRAAARQWQSFIARWQTFADAEDDTAPVRPLLIVQVQDRGGTNATSITQTDLAVAMQAIEDVTGALPPTAFAHAFQEQAIVEIAGRKIRHLPASDITDDPDVQVVFFKTALTTGWDCPRAEVMMSFRTAQDATLIAQLVGRMVRTPLARRITSDETLNTVALYLPHYNQAGLQSVIDHLTRDPENAPPFEAKNAEHVAAYDRAPGTEKMFAALSGLTTYTTPRNVRPNEIKRLKKLARALCFDAPYLDVNLADAIGRADKRLLDAMQAEYDRVRDTPNFQEAITERGTLDVRVVGYLLYGDTDQGKTESLVVSPENIDDLFDAAGKKLGEPIHKLWWRHRVENDQQPVLRPKLEICALTLNPNFKKNLEEQAAAQIKTWFALYNPKIDALPDARRAVYEEIRGLAPTPEASSLRLPQTIEGASHKAPDTLKWKHHLYTDANGDFHALSGSNWEPIVLKAEQKRPDFAAFLRNTERKSWALKIPYRMGSEWKGMYPDFLIVRKQGGGFVIDILEPHGAHLADALPKAQGLAEYARRHGDKLGRIEYITIDEDDTIRRLSLQDPEVQKAVANAATPGDFQTILSKYAD